MQNKYWFKRLRGYNILHRFVYIPISVEGWITTVLYISSYLFDFLRFILFPSPENGSILKYPITMLVATLIFAIIVDKKRKPEKSKGHHP